MDQWCIRLTFLWFLAGIPAMSGRTFSREMGIPRGLLSDSRKAELHGKLLCDMR